MTINSEVKSILTAYNIPVNDGLSYLISVYFDTKPSYTPDIIVQKVTRTGIVSLDDKTKTLQWNIPLFDEQLTNFEWVGTQWVTMFEKANKDRKGGVKECTARMKKFFATNPDVRKDEVIGATEMYIKSVLNVNYLTTSHYFISKGSGADRTCQLFQWIEKYREAGTGGFTGRSSHNNTMR